MQNRHFNLQFLQKKLEPAKIQPVEYKILLKYLKLPEKSEAGVYSTQETLEMANANGNICELIAMGEFAFTDANYKSWKIKPKIGDILITSKYPGEKIIETDTEIYYLCNDKEIIAIYDYKQNEEKK